MQFFAIIPAAGRSRRMGRPKLLLPWDASTILDHVLAVWRASRVDHTVIIVHPDDREIADRAKQSGAIVVVPDMEPPEMKVSVRLGLEAVESRFQPTALDAWLLAPADMPRIATTTIDALIDAHRHSLERGDPPRILAPAVAGRRGHPVLFPWPLAAQVHTLGPREGIDAIVARNLVETIEFTDPGTFDDLDTPEDYERLRGT